MERQSTIPMSDRRQNGTMSRTHDSTAGALTLETLGAAALVSTSQDGTRTSVFGPSKPLALIVYLASVPGRAATREFLIDLLWADLDADAARHAFRQTLWYIKQKTGRALIGAAGDAVSLAEPIPSDRADFLHAAEDRDFERAVALYHGDFLPDFAAPGGLQFEQWADLERQRLRDVFSRSAEHEVRRCLSSARQREAVSLARRARDVDPLSEKAWRLVLESLVSASDPLGASLEADALEKMLAAEERVPEPATRAMLRTAKQLSAEPAAGGAAPSAIVAELVGRESEFASLLAAWDQARMGGAHSVFVIGAAGIGKTRLLSDLVARLRATRCRVVQVRANPGEREIAYSLLSKLAGALGSLPGAAAVSPACAAALVALNPTLSASFTSAEPDRSAGPDALRRRTIAVHELLAAAADEAPIAVIVDDLHWADRESAQAFTGMAELLEREHVLLIAAARPTNTAITQPVRSAAVIRLAPLSLADTGALLASIATLPDIPIAQRLPALVRDASDGVPLLTIETLQFLLDQELLAIANDAWVVADEPHLVRALNAGGALRRRIQSLDVLERAVLHAVALAGVPVPMGFIGDVVQQPLADVAALLHSLEMRGMVSHLDTGWQPAHDQIGELALTELDPEALRIAECAVARAWLHGEADDRALRRAGMHFLRAGDEPAVVRTFVSWVRRKRGLGDRRPAPVLATEFVDGVDAAQTRLLVRGLPFRFRYSAARWRVAATVIFVAAASAATTWQWAHQEAPPPDEQFLAVVVDSAQDTTVYRVGIRRDRWPAGEVLVAPSVGRRVRTALPSSLTDYAVTHDGKAWISWAAMPDSGSDDVVLEPMSGGRQRMTWAPGDDQGASIAPDGSRMAFATGRYDSLSHAHLAIMDLGTHHIRQITRGAGAEGQARWSPNGLYIAFPQMTFTDAPDSLCVIAPDGSSRRCFIAARQPNAIGWVDDRRVLLSVESDTTTTLEVLDTRDGSRRRIQVEASASYQLSPDGRWVSCQCRDMGTDRAQTVLFPIEHPELARTVAVTTIDDRVVPVLWPSPPPPRYVVALDPSEAAPLIPMGTAFQLSLAGTTADGRRIQILDATGVVLDTSVVRVGEHLRLIPVRPGHTRLIVSAGGWRADTLVVRVVPRRDSTVLHDDWTRGVTSQFVPYGEPRPAVVPDTGGRPAFWNGGDGDYWSGAYSRSTFDAMQGLGMETTLSMPITMMQWQSELIAIRPAPDSALLAGWDHRTGYPIFERAEPPGVCNVGYPSVEGERSIHALSTPGGIVDPDTIFRPPLHDGHWFRIRVQLFPDGRCGVAIDGRPVAISSTGAPPTGKYFVDIEGQSFHTRILTGSVEVWTGVRAGVDWVGFDTAATFLQGTIPIRTR